jgi:hypothetical protein
MPVNCSLDEALSNALWLHAHNAAEYVRAAEVAAGLLDDLIRAALSTGSDADPIASSGFVNVDLVGHIAAGGTSFDYLHAPEPA